jgi:leucyl-tRNA synthetase
MGKRFPEFVVNPSDIVREYGADTLRLYEMFMGPLEVSKPWSSAAVAGARKFINRVWNFFTEPANLTESDDGKLTRLYHQTVKKVTSDFESLGFNTAIAQMMVFINEVYKNGSCPREYAEGFIKMMSCITPHVGEEIWQIMGHNSSIAYESWPEYDESKCVSDTIEMPIQVNGKVRNVIAIAKDASKEDVLAVVMSDEKIQAAISGKTIIKEIVVPGKIINIVVK